MALTRCRGGVIKRYVQEIQTYGYRNAPLEEMAYALDGHYSAGGDRLDVFSHVKDKI
jgi:hypothetical protein